MIIISLALTHIQEHNSSCMQADKDGQTQRQRTALGPTQIIGGEAINNTQRNKQTKTAKKKNPSKFLACAKLFGDVFFAILFDSLRLPLSFFLA